MKKLFILIVLMFGCALEEEKVNFYGEHSGDTRSEIKQDFTGDQVLAGPVKISARSYTWPTNYSYWHKFKLRTSPVGRNITAFQGIVEFDTDVVEYSSGIIKGAVLNDAGGWECDASFFASNQVYYSCEGNELEITGDLFFLPMTTFLEGHSGMNFVYHQWNNGSLPPTSTSNGSVEVKD